MTRSAGQQGATASQEEEEQKEQMERGRGVKEKKSPEIRLVEKVKL